MRMKLGVRVGVVLLFFGFFLFMSCFVGSEISDLFKIYLIFLYLNSVYFGVVCNVGLKLNVLWLLK